jgi:hypothetical protein
MKSRRIYCTIVGFGRACKTEEGKKRMGRNKKKSETHHRNKGDAEEKCWLEKKYNMKREDKVEDLTVVEQK